jgi:transposase-like protein
MALEIEQDCPHCDGSTFYRAASTQVQLGQKVKWHCTNCEYGFVRIDGAVDTLAV